MSSSYLKSLRHFQRYEHYIKAIVDAYPKVVKFTPVPPVSSVETLASRIRICINALFHNIQGNENIWETTIPTAKFLQVMDDLVTSTTVEEGKVVCGPRDAVRKITPLGVQVEAEIEQTIPKINLVNPDPELVHAIIVLHHHRILVEPSMITTDLLVETYSKTYDVAIERNGNVYTII